MNDTPPDVADRYLAMLMALTPARRIAMASDMWDAASVLAKATLEATSPDERRVELFLRRYSADFSVEERDRICRRLRVPLPGDQDGRSPASGDRD